jgi:DNA-binding NarL/FixJ family response regulator
VIRIMLVDDQEMIRLGLRSIIDTHPDQEVVAEAADGLAAIKLIDVVRPDVILMDLRMPGVDGVETTRRIRQRYSADQIRIIVLTTFDADANVIAALKAGANGFLSKGVGPTELCQAITEVYEGAGALSSSAATALIEHVVHDNSTAIDPEAQRQIDQLTAREREILNEIVKGLDNDQIAKAFYISPTTVKTHANRAMMKTGCRDRAQLVTLAYRAGIRP